MIIDDPLSAAVAALRNEQVSAQTVRLAADGVSELVRYLGHATLPWSAPAALPLPADVSRLIGALHDVAQHMDQTLGSAGERIAVTGSDSEEARHAVRHLESARETLHEVTRLLAQAHAAAAQLSG